MTFGSFSADGREYILHRWDTPRPWINYLTNGRYCALISQTGGGYSFVESSGYNRITRGYPPLAVLEDRPGRYLYIKDAESGEYWSPTWQPVQRPLERYRCRHGMGYTNFSSASAGIAADLTFFVPVDRDCEVWMARLTNESGRTRRIQVFTYVELSLGSYAWDIEETSFANLFNTTSFEDGVIFATKRYWPVVQRLGKPNLAWAYQAFMGGSLPITGYDTFRESFLGVYGSLDRPRAVQQGQCGNSAGMGQDAAGVLQGEVELLPGASLDFVVVLGAAPDKAAGREIVRQLCVPGAAERELQKVKDFWDHYLGKLWVSTPDPDFDLSVNIWNKYQAWITYNWARMDSTYIGGGSIIGFRDRSQDLLGAMPFDPEGCRTKLIELCRHQFHDGGCIHNWDPIADVGPRTGHSDDPLWLVLTAVYWLKETNRLSLLDTRVPYYDRGEGTVWEHLNRAIDFTLSRRSDRGVPLIGAADWNDALDQLGEESRGESTMVGHHLCWMLREMAELASRRGDGERSEAFLRAFRDVKDALNRHCWDGEWYWRATSDRGEVLGSRHNQEGKIYLNAQTWAVLGGVAEGERALTCMDSMWKHLDTPYGPALFLPAYAEPDPGIGIITRFCPGTKENGTIFNHPVAWAVMAEALLGRADRAYHLFKKTSFLTRGQNPELYKAEPYVYAEYIYGPDSPFFGRGEFSWTTGTAAWMLRVCVDHILGVRPDYDGLRIDPVIPAGWEGFRLRRMFRGSAYEISVENDARTGRGETEIIMNGKTVRGKVLPSGAEGENHEVRVILRSPEVSIPAYAPFQTSAEGPSAPAPGTH